MAAKPVVAGTDGSPESVRAVQWAAREAALRGDVDADSGRPRTATPDDQQPRDAGHRERDD